MATVDLSDLVDPLQISINIPGADLYPDVTEDQWVSYLMDGFWEGYIDGLFEGYSVTDGIVSSTDNTAMPRDLQQLIIMYTCISIIRKRLLALQTVFRAKAGPVEYEVQQSAQVAKALLDDYQQRRLSILDRLTDQGMATGFYYFDTYRARQYAIDQGLTDWVGN